MVRLAGTIHRYVGFSWEEKPYVGRRDIQTGAVITAQDLPVGSTFLAEDTGRGFVYNGESWEPDVDTALAERLVAALNQPLASLLEESRKQTAFLEKIVADIPEGEGE